MYLSAEKIYRVGLKQAGKILYLLLFIIFTQQFHAFGQTKGLIVKTASAATSGVGRAVLDPDGDGYVSVKTNGLQRGFQSNDLLESEIPYRPLPVPAAEPMNDLARGPGGGFSDFADMNSTVYPVSSYLSPAGNLMFRFRLGSIAPNSKGYSVLVDADGKFGFSGANADPEASIDNPGFEFEIVLATNFGVRLYDVNNAAGNATQRGTDADLPYAVYAQKAIAFTTNSGDADYFYDFYIPFSRITQYFPTVTAATALRMVANTIMAPQSAIKGPISDISGIDATYSTASAWTKIISGFVPTPAAGTTSSNFPAVRSDAPVVSSTVYAGTTVSGTSSEATGTVITVYKNGTLLGTTSVLAGGTWTLNSGSVAVNDRIKATATASGESVSDLSNEVIAILNCTYSRTPELVCASDKGFSGRVPGVAANTRINLYKIGDPNTIVMTVYTGTNGMATDEFKYLCSGNYNNASYSNCNPGGGCVGASLGNGSYYARAIETVNGVTLCESPRSGTQCVGNGGTSTAPTLITDPITPATTAISGTGISGSRIVVLADNTLVGSVEIPATPTGTAVSWTLSGIVVSAGKTIQVQQVEAGKCASGFVTRLVTDPTSTPVINGPVYANATFISGISLEPAGTVITIYKNGISMGTATVTASGTWTLTGVTGLVAGNTITATALAANKTISAISNTITVAAAPAATPAVPTITLIGGVAYKEGGTTVNVSVPANTPTGTNINLYIDGYLLRTISTTSTSTSAVIWPVTGLSAAEYELYTGGKLTATLGTIGSNESAQSASVTVNCIPPITKPATVVTNPICEGSQAQFQIANSEDGVIYTLKNGASDRGSSVLGTGGTISFFTWELSTTETFTVTAQKVSGGTCSPTSFAGGTITVNPKPNASNTVTAPATVSGGASVNVQVQNSQLNYRYQLRKNAVNIGSAVTGTGGSINLPTDPVMEESVYEVQVTDITRSTNCTVMLNQVAKIALGTLPVELLNFAAKTQPNSTLVTWATASEKNNDYFEIQKSFDGRDFTAIANVKGAGNSATIKEYAFEDRQITSGLVYYRLKQTDTDGNSEFSKIVAVTRKLENAFPVLYPNPASNKCYLKVQAGYPEEVVIGIYETNGRLLTRKTVKLTAGENNIPLETKTLQPGFYVIKINGNTLQTTFKLQKISE
ncbi:T9SS type A sorting domain-containing protein [Adhaeribacter sp. BT258]|uniref:T9SS type A sorting domain-containing protein n=1 Tax=Adhaeribacter terrigena TaxID=2793070 RepID=A0ABS1BYZ1_9BACT|nr:T9SS type A sorting domain-containing protein [Adhaeribacter terrigena]MBK0402330.1 T9SS type A sorting domain-containing protein [Adhaeribacter terrigena]